MLQFQGWAMNLEGAAMLDRYFHLTENETNVRTELLAGLATFLTMSYIIFVQPAFLSGAMFGSETGMDAGAVMTATCLSAALATAIMALVARYPIALAPGMGENALFTLTVIPAAAAAGFASPWQAALGVVFVSGLVFLALSLTGVRERIINAISPSLKNAIAAGIGLFIAFIGLQNAGLILKDIGTAVRLNANPLSPDAIVFMAGFFTGAVLTVRRVKGAILWGIFVALGVALALKFALPRSPWAEAKMVTGSALMTSFSPSGQIVSAPPSLAPILFKFDLAAAFTLKMFPYILMFVFLDVFDTIGTLVGVAEQAGFMKDNKLPRASRALLSDSIGTVAGAAMGTSTVTSFIESAAGVRAGGRTGLTALATAALFLLALFFSPLVMMVGSYAPITAPALVLVGVMMMGAVGRIEWGDPFEAIPAFLAVIGIPLSYSIADGIALGFICYPVLQLLGGRAKKISPVMAALAAILIVYFVAVRSGLAVV